MNNLNLIVCHDGVTTLDLKPIGLFRNKSWGVYCPSYGRTRGCCG